MQRQPISNRRVRSRGLSLRDADRVGAAALWHRLQASRRKACKAWEELVVRRCMLQRCHRCLAVATHLLRWRHAGSGLPAGAAKLIFSFLETDVVLVKMPLVLMPPMQPTTAVPRLLVWKGLEREVVDVNQIRASSLSALASLASLEALSEESVHALATSARLSFQEVKYCTTVIPDVTWVITNYSQGCSETESDEPTWSSSQSD